MAQSYLFWLGRRFDKCERCQSRYCHNARPIEPIKDISSEEFVRFNQMAGALRMCPKMKHAALAPSVYADELLAIHKLNEAPK